MGSNLGYLAKLKDGKIKRNQDLPTISQDDAFFDLPKGWQWARFPELGEFGRGKSKHRPRNDPKLYEGGCYPLVQTGDVARANRIIETYSSLYNEVGLAQSRIWKKGTLLITIAANIADTAVLGFDACIPDSVVGFVPAPDIRIEIFAYFMKTAKEYLEKLAPSTAQKNINLAILEKLLIPIPPLNEQKRIVAKVEEMMRLCDGLEAKLKDAETNRQKLLESGIRQVLSQI